RAGAGRRARRIELGRHFGLDPVWDVSAVAPAEGLDPAARFDVVLEGTGRLDGWQGAFARTAPGGQAGPFGGPPPRAEVPADSYRLHYEEVRVLGSFHFSPRDVARARDYLLSGRLELAPLIDACLPLDQLPEALRRLQRSEGLQYAIDPWA